MRPLCPSESAGLPGSQGLPVRLDPGLLSLPQLSGGSDVMYNGGP